ncbi:uncharacterized protein LOC134540299 [Bacillus rossius redtenbacheri]|uniref:uncharacterized protein LOC134540299 n=1 Tax=Bacillus rossius redtenbacheri TaxID=93214 RepID=UPI002FDEC8FB
MQTPVLTVSMMMLMTTLTCLVVGALAARARRDDDDAYSTKYDNVDLKEILGSDRLLKGYMDCVMGAGPCTADAKMLKEAIPESLENECKKCNDKQKAGVETVIPFLMKEKPEMWQQAKAEFDPENKYQKRYEHLMKKYEEKNLDPRLSISSLLFSPLPLEGIDECIKARTAELAGQSSLTTSSRGTDHRDMQFIAVVAALCLTAVVSTPARERREDTYNPQYDNINLQDIMKSERLLKSYADCLLEQGQCTPDGKQLKDSIPDALQNECSKCTEKQKEGVKTILVFLINERPEIFAELKKKYDPDSTYEKKYDHYIKEAKAAKKG